MLFFPHRFEIIQLVSGVAMSLKMILELFLSLDVEFSLLIETDSGEVDLNLVCCKTKLLYDILPSSTVCLVFPLLSKMALAWYVVALCEL